MEITIKNYKSILSADLLKKAEQNVVRECDEIEKGHYQGYVDEKDLTYDTSLHINEKGEIVQHNCDCSVVTPFCRHKTALLLAVLKGKKAVKKIALSKKVNPIEQLLLDTDPEDIKLWLLEVFAKNKDLGISFLHHFSRSKEALTPEQVKQLTLDAVKAVVKNRKKVEVGEVKKIVELWEGLHQSIIEAYHAQMADEQSFLCVHALLDTCNEVRDRLTTSSTRFIKYRDTVLQKLVLPFNQLKNEAYWDIATGYFASKILEENYFLRIHYLTFLAQLNERTNPERQQRLTKALVADYLKIDPEQFYDGRKYTSLIFDMVILSGMFDEYYAFFQPIHYYNDYNLALIDNLIEHGMLPLAEKYCIQQIEANSNPEYNEPYLYYLIQIYEFENDEYRLAWVYKQLLPITFDFTTYVYVYSYTVDEAEMAVFRKTMLAHARKAASYDYAAMAFPFHLHDFENEPAKMINYVDTNATYGIITRFADQMAAVNKEGLLKNMCNKRDNIQDASQEGSEVLQELFYDLLHILLKYFTAEELKFAATHTGRNSYYVVPNLFVEFLRSFLK